VRHLIGARRCFQAGIDRKRPSSEEERKCEGLLRRREEVSRVAKSERTWYLDALPHCLKSLSGRQSILYLISNKTSYKCGRTGRENT